VRSHSSLDNDLHSTHQHEREREREREGERGREVGERTVDCALCEDTVAEDRKDVAADGSVAECCEDGLHPALGRRGESEVGERGSEVQVAHLDSTFGISRVEREGSGRRGIKRVFHSVCE
jgi:hypothetical protein